MEKMDEQRQIFRISELEVLISWSLAIAECLYLPRNDKFFLFPVLCAIRMGFRTFQRIMEYIEVYKVLFLTWDDWNTHAHAVVHGGYSGHPRKLHFLRMVDMMVCVLSAWRLITMDGSWLSIIELAVLAIYHFALQRLMACLMV